MENTLVIKLDDYMKLVEEKEKARLMCIELNNKIQTQKEIIEKQEDTIKNLHNYIMEKNILNYYFDNYELEKLIDFDDYDFAINYKEDLLKLGVTKEEMIEFIKGRYEEYKKGQER